MLEGVPLDVLVGVLVCSQGFSVPARAVARVLCLCRACVRLSIRCVVAPHAGPALSGSVLGCGERRPERGAARMNVSTISASPFRMIASARRRSRPARSRQLRLLIGRGLRSPTACSSGVTVRPAWPAAVCAPCHVSAATRGADTSARLLSTNPRSRDHTLCRPVPAGPCCATLA